MSIIENDSIQKYCIELKGVVKRASYTDEHAAYLLKNINDIKYILENKYSDDKTVERAIGMISNITNNKVNIPLCMESILFFRKHRIYTRKHGCVESPIESIYIPFLIVMPLGAVIITPIIWLVDYEVSLIWSYSFAYIPALFFSILNYCAESDKREKVEKDFM